VRVERSDDGFTAWASSRQHALLRTAVLLTGDQGRAEDLVQEALVKVATRWAKLADGYPDAYARTIIYRDNVSWWRRRREVPVGVLPDDAAPYDAHGAERRLMVAAALGRLSSFRARHKWLLAGLAWRAVRRPAVSSDLQRIVGRGSPM
jgi:DNA-directed RNA polymerase specialized sigma24 family protein